MNKARLDVIFGMVIATTALGARGLSCGPCPDTYEEVIPLLPPGNDAGVSDAGDGGVADAGDDFIQRECERLCGDGSQCESTTITVEGGAVPAIICTRQNDCSAGRRPDGLLEPAFEASSATPGGWLARAAFLEAASVDAFRALRRDLAALGAPRRLLRAASRAARDERRHARSMRSMARRHGASTTAPRVRPGAAPTLESLAMQNAAEGCVRETFGALVARWQARAAGDRELGPAMARIAGEEARHAALAWQIDAWARRRLDPAARARVERARDEAARELLAAVARPAPAALVRALGLPEARMAERLAQQLLETLGINLPPA